MKVFELKWSKRENGRDEKFAIFFLFESRKKVEFKISVVLMKF